MLILRYFCLHLLLCAQIFSPDSFGTNIWACSLSKDLPNPFLDDLASIDCDMSALNALEQYAQEGNKTHSQMLKEGNTLAQYMLQADDLSASLFGGGAPNAEKLLGIPGFLWGFCCSVVGVFLVYISTDDPVVKKKEGAQAIFGCAAGTLLLAGLYVWLIWAATYY